MSPGAVSSTLTGAGLTFMLLAWGGITGFTVFCFYRLIRTKERRPSR